MTIVNVIEEQNLNKYLVITQQKDPSTLITTRVVITDNANNKINLINIERGPQGDTGPQGIQGLPGKDGIIFDILPITSGGTNNTNFTNDKIIYFDGSKLTSSIYSVDELINSQNAITGIIPGTGLSKIENGNAITLNVKIGDGLTIANDNIVVDDSIARKSEISLNSVIQGVVPIVKGGTNNSIFNNNTLVYYDGNKLTSFPLATGRIVTSGSQISVFAGSGLVGGGSLSIPNGSVVINIPQSSDIAVLENSIELSTTGTAGTYTKITTDTKGRVISGTQLTSADIISALGYTPWNITNDGEGSFLDADLLDGKQGSHYLNFNNLTGNLSTGIFPNILTGGTFSKVVVNDKGLVINGGNISYQDIVDSLGYRPVSNQGDTIFGDVSIRENLIVEKNLNLGDNLPQFGYNNFSLLANSPRGFSFTYGNVARKTGILAYYPADEQLKLITDIFGDGATDIDGSNSNENGFNGDLDGGNASSVFILGNLDGDQAIVLLEHIADQKYVSLISNQIINGIKTFSQNLTVNKFIEIITDPSYSGPPIKVGSNSGLVQYLNSDLLDNNHGSYYRNAINLTGTLDYRNVTVTNLSGTNTYVPKFDNRTTNPSRTISDSIIRQSGSSLIVIEDGSLSVGEFNDIDDIESLAVGFNNKVHTTQSAAIGNANTASGENSIALNFHSAAISDYSVAMGKYGTTWIDNQISIGSMEETLVQNPIVGPVRIAHAQHSIASLGYVGSPGPNFTKISSPSNIEIPKNKTVRYDVDLLFTKFGGSGVASFSFSSGIVKNINGNSVVIQQPIKQEIYNDSQIREYLYNTSINLNKDNENQILSVNKPPMKYNSPSIQNVPKVWRIKPELSEISGSFTKTFDGKILLDMEKPIFSGYFTQDENTYGINIKSYNHSGVLNSLFSINYVSGVSGFLHKPVRNPSGHKIVDIVDQNNFIISDHLYNASYRDGYIFITNTNLYTNFSTILFNGTLNSGSNIVSLSNNFYLLEDHLLNDMVVDIYSYSYYPDTILFNNSITPNDPLRITSIDSSSNSLTLNHYYNPLVDDEYDYGPGYETRNFAFELNSLLYSIYKLEKASKIYFKSETINSSFIRGSTEITSSGIKIYLTDYSGPTSIDSVQIAPLSNNSGTLTLCKKRSYDGCSYDRQAAQFPSWSVTYLRDSSKFSWIPAIGSTSNLESNTIQVTPPIPPIDVNYLVSGVGIPNNTIVNNINYTNSTVTVSKNVTLANGTAINFTNPQLTTSDLFFTTTETDRPITFLNGYSPYVKFTSAFNSFSGTLTSGSPFITNCLPPQPGKIVNGMVLFADRDGLNYSGIVTNVEQHIITMNTVFTGVLGSKDTLITYYGTIPYEDNYIIHDIDLNQLGFTSKKTFSNPNSGIYVSGQATLYPTYGTGLIRCSAPEPSNFAQGELVYLRFLTGNVSSPHKKPIDGNYKIIDAEGSDFDVNSLHLYPDSGISCQGTAYATLDRDHGYVQPKQVQHLNQHIPLIFSISDSDNDDRKPKDNILEIISVTGHNIVVNDSRYSMLKEVGKSRIYDRFIDSYYKKFNELSPGPTYSLAVDSKVFKSFYENDKILAKLDGANYYREFKIEDIQTSVVDKEFHRVSWSQVPYQQGSLYITFLANISPPFDSSKYRWPEDFSIDSLSVAQTITKGIVTSGFSGITNCFPQPNLDPKKLLPGLGVTIRAQNQNYNRTIHSFSGDNSILLTEKIDLNNALFADADIIYTTNLTAFTSNNGASQFGFGPLSSDGSSFTMFFNSGAEPAKFNAYISTADSRLALQSSSMGSGESSKLLGNPVTTYYMVPLDGMPLPVSTTGTISYIGYQDGKISSPLHNCYFHSYGNKSEYWGRDNDGKYVEPGNTGIYRIYHSEKLCESGTLCVHISGINDFSLIQSGQKLFFDFLDTSSTLTGVFSVNDKLNPQVITIDIPYNSDHVDNSGTVYIVDSNFNIKTDKNPNINNSFAESSLSTNLDIAYKKISSFNRYNNRWKHCFSLSNSGLTHPTGFVDYPVSVNHEGSSINENINLVVLNEDYMDFDVSYSFDDINYIPILPNQTILTTINESLFFNISVSGGAGKWSNSIENSVPRIKILGLSNYSIEQTTSNSVTDFFGKKIDTWSIKISTNAPISEVTNKKIKFLVADESGRKNKDIKITTTTPLTITDPEQVLYGTTNNSTNSWKIVFEIFGGYHDDVVLDTSDPDTQLFLTKMNYTIQGVSLNNPPGYFGYSFTGRCKSQSSVVSETIFYPKILVKSGQTTVGEKILRLDVKDISQQKSFEISLRAFKNNISIDRTITDSKKISFLIPCETTQLETPPTITIGNRDTLGMNTPTSYFIPQLQSYYYSITIPPNNQRGFYNCSISINNFFQPSGGSIAGYSLVTGVDLTVYNPIAIDTYRLIESIPISSDINNPWILNIDVLDGAFSRSRNDRSLKLYLGNTPNIGRYNNFSKTISDYDIGYSYNTELSVETIKVSGKTDIFGEFAVSTGNYDIFYYIEDYTSYNTGIIPVRITGGIELKNINEYKYATINNGFDFNFDISDPTYNYPEQYPKTTFVSALSIPDNARKYSKYDTHTNVWEYHYRCDAMTQRWDALVQLNGNNLDIKVKGLLDDKIYVAGKLDTIETENLMFLSKPLRIKTLAEKKEIIEGETWEFTLITEGGLEDPRYPPQIILVNTPTSCTGYDPSIPGTQSCSMDPAWSQTNKEWSYKFIGAPLCTIGNYKVSVNAIDKIGSVQYGQDNSGILIVYKSGEEHPGPGLTIGQLDPLYPNCTPVDPNTTTYKINQRELCPQPTGISGFKTYGTLPNGLSFANFPLEHPVFPYVTGGYAKINGYPTQFADGGDYPNKFSFAVIDFRGKQATGEFTFKDGSTPMEPSPTDMTLYFDKPGYTYSPSTGTKIITNEDQDVLRPPGIPFSMKCMSKLPHNKCVYSTGSLTTALGQDGTVSHIRIVSGSITSSTISNSSPKYIPEGGKIYIESLDYPGINTEYTVRRKDNPYVINTLNSSYLYDNVVYISGTTFPPLVPDISIQILNTTNNIKNENFKGVIEDYKGKPESTINVVTSTGIMGSGSVIIQDEVGIIGRLKPSRIATVHSTGYLASSSHLSSLNVSDIPGEENTEPHVINFSNCYETGQIRISGMIVPKIYLDFTDPPPGSPTQECPESVGAGFYSTNECAGQFAIQIKSTYGNTPAERSNISANVRTITFSGTVVNELNGDVYLPMTSYTTRANDGQIEQGFGFPNIPYNSPAIFSYYVIYPGDIFPTFKRNSIPAVSSVTYWIHKPSDKPFPPVLPLDKFDLVLPIDQPINKGFQFAGGFIGTSQNTQYTGLLPHITGYIQENPFDSIKYSGFYYQSGNGPLYLEVYNDEPVVFSTGDALFLDLLTQKDTSNTAINILPSPTGSIINIIDPDQPPEIDSVVYDYLEQFNELNHTPNNSQKLYISNFALSFDSNVSPPVRSGIFSGKDLFQIYYLDGDINIAYNNSITGIITSGDYLSQFTAADFIKYQDKSKSLFSCAFKTEDVTYDELKIDSNQLYFDDPRGGIAKIESVDSSLVQMLDSEIFVNGTGLCFYRRNIADQNLYFIRTQSDIDAALNRGYSTATLTGQLSDPYKDYIYRVITCENIGLVDLTPSDRPTNASCQRYAKDFPLVVTKIPEIIDSSIQFQLTEQDSWELAFEVSGGYIPRSGQLLEIEINDNIHTFTRKVYSQQRSGVYVELSSRNGYSWTSPINLRVFDSIGTGTKNITFP